MVGTELTSSGHYGFVREGIMQGLYDYHFVPIRVCPKVHIHTKSQVSGHTATKLPC